MFVHLLSLLIKIWNVFRKYATLIYAIDYYVRCYVLLYKVDVYIHDNYQDKRNMRR